MKSEDKRAASRRVRTGIIAAAFLLTIILTICWAASGEASGNSLPASPMIPEDRKPAAASPAVNLSPQEIAWLAEHPVIRVAQDPGWPPIEFAGENGQATGMTSDYVKIVERRLGIRFLWVHGLNWQEAYDRLKRREIDMTTSVAVTPERNQFWSFTKPYMKIPIVIVAGTNVTYISDMRELDGKKVAIVDGYAVSDWIPRDFPEIHLVRLPSALECLKALQRGDVFAYVDNMLVVGYYMAQLKMTTLKIAGETPYVNAQCMAVRKDWAPLAGILQKALASISETERSEIYRKWLPIRYEHGFDYTMLWYALAVFALMLAGLTLWNWKLLREIKARKLAEAALRISEDRFRIVFESANAGKSITLPTGELNVNQSLCDMLGYSREELRGKKWQDLTPPDDVASTQNILDTLLKGEKDATRYNKRYARKDGSIIWADVSVAIHRDAKRNPLYFITTVIDITDRKHAEDNLRASEERFRRIFQHSALGMTLVSPDFQLFSANKSFCDMMGYTEAELSAKTFEDMTLPDDRPVVIELARETLAGKREAFLLEKRYRRKDGGEIWGLTSVTLLRDAENQPLYFVGQIQDITGRKRAEEEIRELNEALEKKVADRTEELRSTILKMEEINKVFVGRELKMAELKKRIEELEGK